MTTSYDNDNEHMIITCDTEGCGEQDEATGTFRGCIAEFKERGWKTFMVEGEWNNSCPSCFENWKVNSFKNKVAKDKADAESGEAIYPSEQTEIPF